MYEMSNMYEKEATIRHFQSNATLDISFNKVSHSTVGNTLRLRHGGSHFEDGLSNACS